MFDLLLGGQAALVCSAEVPVDVHSVAALLDFVSVPLTIRFGLRDP